MISIGPGGHHSADIGAGGGGGGEFSHLDPECQQRMRELINKATASENQRVAIQEGYAFGPSAIYVMGAESNGERNMTFKNDDVREPLGPLPPEIAVDLELIDFDVPRDYDPENSTGDMAIHVPGRTVAHTSGGGRLSLDESKQCRIEWGIDDALVAWLPVYVRSIRSSRVIQTEDEAEASRALAAKECAKAELKLAIRKAEAELEHLNAELLMKESE